MSIRRVLWPVMNATCIEFQVLFEELARGLVPEIVEVKSGNPRVPAGFGEVPGDRIRSDIPDLSVEPSGSGTVLEN